MRFWGARLLLVSWLLCLPTLGHGSGELAKEKYERLSEFVEAAFVELDRTDDLVPRSERILFLDREGKAYSLPKSRLAHALAVGIEASLRLQCQNNQKESHSKETHDHDGEGHCQSLTEGTKSSRVKLWSQRLLNFFLAPLHGAVETFVELPPKVAELAGEFGVIPAVVAGIIWVPYTIITEAIESAVFAHYHWACTFFQAVFFFPLHVIFTNYASVRDAIMTRGTSQGLFQRLGTIFSSRFREWRFRMALRTGFLSEKTDDSIPLHPQGPIFPLITEIDAIKSLNGFLDSLLDAAHELGNISYLERTRLKYHVGRLGSLITFLQNARRILAREPDPTQAAEWMGRSERTITETLRAFLEVTQGKKTTAGFADKLSAATQIVLEFRRGKVPCGFTIAAKTAA